MSVPFLDLAGLHDSIRGELDEAVDRVLRSSAFIGGGEVRAFEEAFAHSHHATAAAGCASGTDALALALRALGVGPGDEVIVPSMTFVATAEAVVHVGATPVVADVDETSLLLSREAVDAVRSPATRAVIPVHLYGHLVAFDDLRSWRDSGLLVVEDAAQAHLATWEGDHVGTVGHAACFSFYPGKNLGALGDGGMVISSDGSLVDEVRRLANHGRVTKYEHDVIGWCSRLDGLQAAVLGVKLRHLAEWTENRRELAQRYLELLGDEVVPWSTGAVHHLVVARLRGIGVRREAVRSGLGEAGIGSGVHYPVPLSRQPSLASFSSPCPNAERAATEIVSLPVDPLFPPSTAETVVAALFRTLDSLDVPIRS